MSSILITGSNRGLGLEWARQHAQQGWRVYATCRHPSEAAELHALAARHTALSVHHLDVTRHDEVQALAVELQHEAIDLLVNNAGVYLEKFDERLIGRISYDDWLDTVRVNTLGAIRMTEALVEQVARSRRRLVVAITSHMGSIAEISEAGSYYYRSSKAALNSAMKGLSVELKARGIGIMLMHPGWVQTRMGGPGARYTPTESVQGMRKLIDRFDLADTGRFFRFDGTEIPW